MLGHILPLQQAQLLRPYFLLLTHQLHVQYPSYTQNLNPGSRGHLEAYARINSENSIVFLIRQSFVPWVLSQVHQNNH